MDNITEENIRKICRICFKIQPHMRFLASTELIEGKFCTLLQMLKTCTSVEVCLDDKFPNMVCQSCINRLYVSWDFKMDCEKSEAKLCQIIKNDIEESINVAASTCDVIMDSATSLTKENDIQVLKVIAVKNLKNNLKVVRGKNGDNTKRVIVENLDQILKENNAKLHNNNNNVSQKIKQNRRLHVENEIKQLEQQRNIILENSPVLLYNNENESPNSDKECYEDIKNMSSNSLDENLNEDNSSCVPIKNEEISFNVSMLKKFETIDLTLSDSEDNANDDVINIEIENSERDSTNTPSPAKKTKNIDGKKNVPTNENALNNHCTYCKINLPTNLALRLHLKTHEDPIMHCCPICDKTFGVFSNLEMHMKTHVGAKNALKCPKCPKYFSSLDMLNRHKQLHDVAVTYFVCELCCKKFATENGLEKHLHHTHSGINQYFCDVCMKGFSLKIMLNQHRKIHEQNKFDVRDTSFTTLDELTEHNETHAHTSPDPPLEKCDKCDEIFTTDDALKQHRVRHHNIVFCKLCPSEFDNKSDLKQHKQEHKRKRSFTCKTCENVFDSMPELKTHIKTHFICGHCSDSFQNIRILNLHKRKHIVSSLPTKNNN